MFFIVAVGENTNRGDQKTIKKNRMVEKDISIVAKNLIGFACATGI
jgi:hypothetical protein